MAPSNCVPCVPNFLRQDPVRASREENVANTRDNEHAATKSRGDSALHHPCKQVRTPCVSSETFRATYFLGGSLKLNDAVELTNVF